MEEVEIWKDIPEYEGLYQVSNFGRVKSFKRKGNNKERILTASNNNTKKYWKVQLSKKDKIKHFSVHKLVALAFIPNPENLPCVNHKDENKDNNHVSNLEWCTYQYNTNYGTRNERARNKMINGKLAKPILQFSLKGEFIKEWESISEIQRQLNINVSYTLLNKTIHTYNYFWFYKDGFSYDLLEKQKTLLSKAKIKRSINQFTKEGILIREWDSTSSIYRELNYNHSNILKCCRNEIQFAYGFIWKFKE